MPRPVVAKDPRGRLINHRTPTAPKGQNEIAQGRAKRRPGYGSVRVDAPRGSALSGLGRIRAHRTQGVALGYHLAPRWGKRPLDHARWNILPRSVVAKDQWGRVINHRNPTAPKGQNEIAQGRAKRRPGYVAYGLMRREVPPFQGLEGFGPTEPRALPWAITLRPVGAKDH
jgi:hypothetical protein